MAKRKVDFFISYTKADLAWAEWLDFSLKKAGYSTIVQFADFKAGQNIINSMHEALQSAERVIGVLSTQYLESPFAAAEWMAALHDDPLGKKRRLLFVRVSECKLTGLLPNIIYIDLIGLSEQEAEEKLLRELRSDTSPPKLDGRFPPQLVGSPVFPPVSPRVWQVPGIRKPFFTGREQLIVSLIDYFSSSTQSVVTLTGTGGTGKSRIAVEYCHRQIEFYEVIWWIDASQETLIRQGLTGLATELSLGGDLETLSQESLLRLLDKTLRTLRCLLIFDNTLVRESTSIIIGQLPTTHILITSRNPSWPDVDRVIEVPVLDRECSIEFLTARSRDSDAEAANELCIELGDLPIALEQAGLYIERTASEIRSYTKRFRERRAKCSKFEDEAERAIAAVWLISVRRLMYEDFLAILWLRVLSFLGPHRIPRQFFDTEPLPLSGPIRLFLIGFIGLIRLLYRMLEDDADNLVSSNVGKTYSLEARFESLRRYGLLELTREDVSLHPLVRSVIQSETRKRFRPALINICIRLLVDASKDSPLFHAARRLWCLHVMDLGKRAEMAAVSTQDLIQILVKAADLASAFSVEQREAGTKTLERALRCARMLELKQRFPWELVCLFRLATDSRELDRFSEAVGFLRQALAILLDQKEVPPGYLIVPALAEYANLLLLDYETSYASKFLEAAISLERRESGNKAMLASLLAQYAELLRVAGEYDAAEEAVIEGLTLAKEDGANGMAVARLQYLLGKIQSCKGESNLARRNLQSAFDVIHEDFGAASPYLRDISFELDLLEHLELRQGAAKLFQTPRNKDTLSGPVPDEKDLHASSDILHALYEMARTIALDDLHRAAIKTLVRNGFASNTPQDRSNLHEILERGDVDEKEIGRVLSPLIVPIYRSIAEDTRWLGEDEVISIFREEMLQQYSISFRQRMVIELGSKGLSKLPKGSPSFEDYIDCFSENLPDFLALVPGCLLRFEERLLKGDLTGSRRGIHGLALQLDAPFYFQRLTRLGALMSQ